VSLVDSLEWEERVKTWLRLKYGGQFETVPDDHGGDLGIEGFSRDGIAYQCYSPREILKAAELFANQRRKLGDDVGKFIDNSTELQALFGTLHIQQYWFVVPEHRSAKLVQFATRKAAEIVAAHLPYVDAGFFVHIATEEDFAPEIRQCTERNYGLLQVSAPAVDTEAVGEWANQNDAQVAVVDAKASRLLQTKDRGLIARYRTRLLAQYIDGQNCLESLRISHSHIWEMVQEAVLHREKFVSNECLQVREPQDALKEQLERLTSEISASVPGFHRNTLDTIVHGIAGEWWIKCDIDFRGEE
jgi:hypothetical protein